MKAASGKLSVVIVDDNEPVCRSLRASPIWESLPATVSGTASSAEEAKVLIRRIRPEILITDIKIPGSDGMQLASYARSVLEECRVIFITAYDEFELAQKAVRVDAADFILKPIRDEEIERAVRKITAELIDSRRRGRETELLRIRYGEIEEQFRAVETQAREKLLSDLLHGRIADKREARERMTQVGMKFHRYRVILISNARGSTVQPRLPEELEQLFGELRDTDRWDEVAGLFLSAGTRGAFAVVDFFAVCSDARTSEILRELAAMIRDASKLAAKKDPADSLREEDPVRMFIGASDTHSEPLSLRRAYEESIIAADQGFFGTSRQLHLYSDLPSSSTFREDRLHRRRELLQEALTGWTRRESPDELEGLVDDYFDELREAKHLGRGYAEGKLEELAAAVRAASEHLDERITLHLEPGSFRSLREARGAVAAALRSGVSTLPEAGSPLQRHHIELVSEFLAARYSEPVRLVDAARAVGLSTSHLSRLIRKTTGQTFTEMLTSFRLKAATRLLRETNAKVYEIADMVGMKNHAYFYQVFRKYLGVSPNDLR